MAADKNTIGFISRVLSPVRFHVGLDLGQVLESLDKGNQVWEVLEALGREDGEDLEEFVAPEVNQGHVVGGEELPVTQEGRVRPQLVLETL